MDDERNMHAFKFEKQDLKKNDQIFMQMSYIFRWVSCIGLYYIDGEEDGYKVPG
jgi:hypothetical protein